MSKVDWDNIRPDDVDNTKNAIIGHYASHNDKELIIPFTDPKLQRLIQSRPVSIDPANGNDQSVGSVFNKVVQKPVKTITLIAPMEYQLVDPTLPTLQFATDGSAGLDLYNRLDEIIPPFAMGYKIPLNVKIKIASQVWLMLAARSSFAMKYGLLISNAVGVIDQDFSSELALLVYNPTSEIKKIPKGAKIAQIIAMPSVGVTYKQVDSIDDNKDHLGFGSTDGK